MPDSRSPLVRWAAPFVLFMLFLPLADLLKSCGVARAAHYVYPAQTVLCGALVWLWRRHYCGGGSPQAEPTGESAAQPATPPSAGIGPFWSLLTALFAGLLVFALWVAPQAFFGQPPRLEGFNPGVFGENSPAWWATLGMRFLRLVVVVPLVEEIFWRGFLLRYLIREDFLALPVGAFSWKSFAVVALLFTLAHQPADYPAALLTGILYNLVAVGTRRLWPCVAAHAVTNLLLGVYIVQTRQWGFW